MIANATKLRASMFVRYWEDARVNGVEDVDGALIPLRVGQSWDITIRLADGVIEGWPTGVMASIHYKVCDAGLYQLLADDNTVIAEYDGYVPECLSPKEPGFGDYVIFDVSGDGHICGWRWPVGLDRWGKEAAQ